MPRIAHHSIDRLLQSINIYDVISPVVALKKAGSEYRGLSPFTSEKTPSFYVNPQKNVWYCYSSQQGGSVIAFLEKYENLPFPEAVEALAERFSIPLEYESGGPAESPSLKRQLLDIHDIATEWFHERLMDPTDPHAAEMRAYWTGPRAFSLKLAQEFRIGFAPPDGCAELFERFSQRGIERDALRQCGLFYVREESGSDPRRWKPRFRGRLMIPIRSYQQGRVVAFTARQTELTPEDDPAREAKYINSPETPLFEKGRLLFNLDRAGKHTGDEAPFLLVEGQLDALRCWSLGLKTAVAPQGTAVTPEQMRLARRYTGRMEVLLDGDSAGAKAAIKVIPLALQAGIDVDFLTLPEKEDPDSFFRREGFEGLARLRANRHAAMPFAVRSLLPDVNPTSAQIAQAQERVFEILLECPGDTVRDTLLGEVAGYFGMHPTSVARDFERFRRSRFRRPARPLAEQALSGGGDPPGPPAEMSWNRGGSASRDKALTTAEAELFLCVFHDGQLGSLVAQVLQPEWIDRDTVEGRLLNRLLGEYESGNWEGTSHADSLFETDEERQHGYALLARNPVFEDSWQVANNCLVQIFKSHLERQVNVIRRRIANLPADSDEFPALKRQQIALRQAARHPPQLPRVTAEDF